MKKLLIIFWITVLIPFLGNGQTKEEKRVAFFQARFDSLSKLPANLKNDTLRLMALDSIIESSAKNKDKNIYNNYKKIVYDLKWPLGIAKYKMYYANSSIFNTNSALATKLFIEAEKELERLGDYKMQIYALMRLSMVITHKSDSLSAQKYIDKAITLARIHKDQIWLIKALNYKANTFVYRDRLDLALPIFQEIEKFENLQLNEKIVNDLNLGTIYMYTNRVEKGMKYQLNALKMIPKHERLDLQQDVRFEIISFFIGKKDFKSAKQYYLQLAQFFEDYKPHIEKAKRYYDYGYIIEKNLNNLPLALTYLEQKSKYQDSVMFETKKNVENGLKSEIDLNDQKLKNQQVELLQMKTQQSKQVQLRWFLILLCLIGFLVGAYILKVNRALKRQNNELLNKNKEISEALLRGQTTERQRVAIDLHDNLGSTISSIKYSLEAIDRSKMNADELAVQENLYSLLDKAYNDVRLLSHNLLPEEFEKLGLTETLKSFVRKMNKNSNIKFELEVDDNLGRLDKKVEFELYSICLELVNNIIKHSKASEAKITLKRIPPLGVRGLLLVVSDNGIGTFKNDSDGRGMKNVQARVDSINGSWTVKAVDGEGVVNEIVV